MHSYPILAEKESTIERLELQEDTGTPGADHARRRAQTTGCAPPRPATSVIFRSSLHYSCRISALLTSSCGNAHYQDKLAMQYLVTRRTLHQRNGHDHLHRQYSH